jgi:hypothetical protein
MTTTVIALETRTERAARAYLASLTEAQRTAVYDIRDVILDHLFVSQSVAPSRPEDASGIREMADALDDSLCVLLGLQGFKVRDIPPEDE